MFKLTGKYTAATLYNSDGKLGAFCVAVTCILYPTSYCSYSVFYEYYLVYNRRDHTRVTITVYSSSVATIQVSAHIRAPSTSSYYISSLRVSIYAIFRF